MADWVDWLSYYHNIYNTHLKAMLKFSDGSIFCIMCVVILI